eukprot:GFYU01002980.1.p1 GENE.GFYU01002980.1~~GFYU01002980.1.p1  ORF type:complete len:131 (-),score=28.24 GFYU01002980.1:125-517(-)
MDEPTPTRPIELGDVAATTSEGASVGLTSGVKATRTRTRRKYSRFNSQLDDDDDKLPVKTALTAGALLIVGVVFTILGLVYLFEEGDDRSAAFFIIGGITILPGGYHSWILFNAWRRVPGFKFSQVDPIQ